MNTKYTLENDSGYLPGDLHPKSIREAKKAVVELEPKTATIKNKRGKPIHQYTKAGGWKPIKPKKQSQTWLITVGYSIKKRKAITVPYSQYNV